MHNLKARGQRPTLGYVRPFGELDAAGVDAVPLEDGLYGWGGPGRESNALGLWLIPPRSTLLSEMGRILTFEGKFFGLRSNSVILYSNGSTPYIGIICWKFQRHSLRISSQVQPGNFDGRRTGCGLKALNLA